jgi:hypothetical protein
VGAVFVLSVYVFSQCTYTEVEEENGKEEKKKMEQLIK